MRRTPIGRLREKLTLETKSAFGDAETDANGQEIETWSPASTHWGSVEPLSGRELSVALQINNQITHRITTRFRPGRNLATCRWRLGSRIFNIISARNLEEMDVEQEFLCVEVVA